jgi:hypothetical protein
LELTERYEDGDIPTRLAKRYGIDIATVRNIVDRYGVERQVGKRAKYRLNPCAFDLIDSEEAAYLLGFIYADGGVNAYNRLTVELQERDIEVLYNLRRFLESDAPINIRKVKIPRTGEMTTACVYHAHSQYLAERLKGLGIVPRRGHFCLTELAIPSHLFHHFIRGFMDGDGSLTQSGDNPMIRFYGQTDILIWIRGVFHRELGTNPELTIRQKTGIKVIAFCGGRQCRKIVRWLYKDATIWLDRKRKIADGWDSRERGGVCSARA